MLLIAFSSSPLSYAHMYLYLPIWDLSGIWVTHWQHHCSCSYDPYKQSNKYWANYFFFSIFQPFSCMINLHFFILVQPFTCLNLLWLLLGFICSLPNLLETKRLCFFVSSLPLFCYFSWNLLLEHLLLEHTGELHIMILKREKRSKKDQVQGAKHPKKEENQKNQKTNSAWTQLSWHSISELKT